MKNTRKSNVRKTGKRVQDKWDTNKKKKEDWKGKETGGESNEKKIKGKGKLHDKENEREGSS